jgi:hypothetical protein
MKSFIKVLLAVALFQAGLAVGEPLNISAVLTPKEQIRLDFQDGSGHFVLMVKRAGVTTGSGILAGAEVTEFGRHDITPNVSGDPSGYLVLTKSEGNIAYIKWTVRAIFLPAKDGKSQIYDNGFWEVVSGTGSFKSLKGAGTLHIKPAATPTDRSFILEGETTLPQ